MTTGAVFRRLAPDGASPREIAEVVNGALAGKLNALADLTLTANVASTTLTDSRIGATSYIDFMPTTANAGAEIGAGTLYVSSRTKGSAVVTHGNNAQADRTYRVLIIG